MNEKDSTGKRIDLRKRAEDSLRRTAERAEDNSELTQEEVRRLIHELKVQQIELEMQNEELRQAQVSVEELKDNYIDLYDFAPVGYVTIGETGLVEEANLTLCNLLQIDRDSLIEQPFYRFVTEADRDRYYFHRRSLFEAQAPQTCDIQLVRRNGDTFHARLDSLVTHDGRGEFKRCRMIISDITEGKKAEESLSEKERSLQRRTEELSQRVKELNCLYAISRLLERPVESVEAVLSEVMEIVLLGFRFHDAMAARIVFDDREFRSKGFGDEYSYVPSAIVVDGVERGIIEVGLTKDLPESGEAGFLKEEKALLDAIAASVGIAIDRYESARRLSQELYFQRSLIEAFPGPLFYKDTDHIYRGCNEAFAKFIGRSRKDVVGKSVYEVAPADLADTYRQKDEELFHNPGLQVYESSVKGPGGTVREVAMHKATFNDSSGNVAGLIGVILDVTERKNIERQLRKAQRLESVATLASGIAHDFNNLLTIISGYAELGLADKKEGDSGYNEFAVVLEAARRGADLVKQILTFSREAETRPKPTNLNRQVEHAQKLLYKTIPKMIDIQTHLADDLKIVMADPAQIEQILLNLAVNARDAMPDGGKLVFQTENCVLDTNYCRLHAGVQPGEYVALTISDTGKGMKRDIQDRIFDPFFSTKKPGEGTGLGLAMVFGIVKKHDGHITCYSEPGAGATFKIYFPVTKEGKFEPDFATTAEFAAMGSETILLVDDEELIRDLGTRILTESGYHVLAAANGKEALQLYEKEGANISLVILDVIMPEMGGKECLDKLRTIDPNVKVLIASGFTPDAKTKETLESGAAGFVGKPFQMDKLLRAVRRVLDER